MTEVQNSFFYLLKIIVAVVLLLGAFLLTTLPDSMNFPLIITLFLPLGVYLIFIPLLYFVYQRLDELQKLLHKQACVLTMAVVVPLFAVIAIMQNQQLLIPFNFSYAALAVVGIWASSLILVDRFYK